MNLAIFDVDGTLTLPYEAEDECYLASLRTVLGFSDVDPDWRCQLRHWRGLAYPHVAV